MTQDTPDGWDGILDPGEVILWQGRPDSVVTWTGANIAASVFGLVFSGFAVFWMVMASRAPGAFWMFGLIHFFAGLAIGIGPPFWSAWRRRHTWYTLTDRRAFIATDIPTQGRKLKSYPIEKSTAVEYRAGDPATIHFAHEYRRTKNGSRKVPIGFERIRDGEAAYRLFREVQRRTVET